MRLLKAIGLILVFAPVLAASQGKPKKSNKVPAVFSQARYVYVEAVDGQEFDPRLNPDDRNAIIAVYKALNDWNRYVQTQRREQADLIFVVRRGRMSATDVDGHRGPGPGVYGQPAGVSRGGPGCSGAGNGGPGPGGPGCDGMSSGMPSPGAPGAGGQGIGGPGYGGAVGEEVGPPADLLEVYQSNPNGPRGTLLWERTLVHGLDPPGLALFKQLKDQVERAYPSQTASQTPKP